MGDMIRGLVKNGGKLSQAKQWECLKDDNAINAIIERCLTDWGLSPGLSNYALRIDRSDQIASVDNLDAIHGKVLILIESNDKLISDLLNSLGTHESKGINDLPGKMSLENADGQEYLDLLVDKYNGIPIILNRLSYDLKTHEDSKVIGVLLEGLALIINKRPSVLHTIEEKGGEVIDLIAKNLSVPAQKAGQQNQDQWLQWDSSRLKHSLNFLTVIQKSKNLSVKVREVVIVNKLLDIITGESLARSVHRSALALFNELVLNNEEDRTGIVHSMTLKKVPQFLSSRYASDERCSDPGDMRKQLVYVQCWTLLKYQRQMNTPIGDQDSRNFQKIKELIDIAFPDKKEHIGSGTLHKQRYSDEYKTLGFESYVDPKKDFEKPPGELALQIIYDFANKHPEAFNKTVTDYNLIKCPFARSAIGLVKVLCQVLGVGEDPLLIDSSNQLSYYPFILSQEDFLQDMFEICIKPLLKTWRDMQATTKDFHKVMDVTREQLQLALKDCPKSLRSGDNSFKSRLLPYTEIAKIWKEGGRTKADCGAIQALKEVLTPEIEDLIRVQRLNFACAGTMFSKQNTRSSKKHTFVKLSPHQKYLWYGDWNQRDTVPEAEDLHGKMAIDHIKEFKAHKS